LPSLRPARFHFTHSTVRFGQMKKQWHRDTRFDLQVSDDSISDRTLKLQR